MAKRKVRKRRESDLEKILENLIKLTTIPREKSVIQWRMDKVFEVYYFEAEYRGKIYKFDGRHFYVYPAGYELPPGIRIGDKTGPGILLYVKITAAPELFGELWQRVCGQHEKELREEQVRLAKERDGMEQKRRWDQKRALENTKKILGDFR